MHVERGLSGPIVSDLQLNLCALLSVYHFYHFVFGYFAAVARPLSWYEKKSATPDGTYRYHCSER